MSFSKLAVSVFVVLLAVLLCVAALRVSATCGFDKDNALQAGIAADLAKPVPSVNVPANNRVTDYAGIRIVVSTLDLDDTSKYCTAAGESKPDFKGGSLTCTADDILTTAKKEKLLNEVLPYAVKLLKNALQVVPLTGNLFVGSTSQCSGGFTIPASHTTGNTGVANADYVLYVAAGPTTSGNIAFAGGCQTISGGSSRIIVGRANFGPKYLAESTLALRDMLATGVHEILHAMGYSYTSFQTANIVEDITVRSISKPFVTSFAAKNKSREFIGCGTIPGVELENEGGAGSAQSHPDRRIYKDDIMAATSGHALSVTTLAVMEGLGVYKANYSAAENMVTGKGLGCGYATADCNTAEGGLYNVWCPTASVVNCTSALDGYGPCTSSPQFTDSCKYHIAYSNKQCYDSSQTDLPDIGDTFHENSRCFNTEGSFKQTGSNVVPSATLRCLKARCIANIVSVAVGRNNNNFQSCTGTSTSVFGYQGSVLCGNTTRMCDALRKLANATEVVEALQPIRAIPIGKTERAYQWIYTTKVVLTLSGLGWAGLTRRFYGELFTRMQLDIAQLLYLEQQNIWIDSVVAGSNSVTYVVKINCKNTTTAIDNAFNNVEGSRSWMPRTASLYASQSGSSDSPVLANAYAQEKPSNTCTPYIPSFEDTDTCNGFIAGLVFAALLFFGTIIISIWKCCCSYQPPPQPKNVKYQVK